MSARSPKCPHLVNVAVNEADIGRAKEICICSICGTKGPNLWLCVYRGCLRIGCGEANNDHSTQHFKDNRIHCVHLNLSTLRSWCYLCETEVYIDLMEELIKSPVFYGPCGEFGDSSDSEGSQEDNGKPLGLTGLQNIGNTCYMNSALQALSNTTPLTHFFLDCGAIVIGKGDKKPGLSCSYLRLVQEMWHRKRPPYVVPSGILCGIRNVHPMFRGYQQHDTQEFLRCFMDQLHEELKEPVIEKNKQIHPHDGIQQMNTGTFDDASDDDENGNAGNSSQSEAEYETCDSGVSERSSLSDEGERNQRKSSMSRSSSPEHERLSSKHTSSVKGHGCASQRPTTSPPHSPTRANRNKKHFVKYRSIISDVFDGKVLSSVQCLTCDRISTRVETFQDLSLPIPSRDHIHMLHQGSLTPQKGGLSACSDVYTGKQGWISWIWEWFRSWFWGPTVSLHDCLAAFFSADELKGDNMYSCEKCNKLRNGVKYSKVLELPEVLCIHLKRFRHELMFSAKIGSYVSFPLEGLDMRPYLHKDCVSQVTNYNLVSVICHHGTAGAGHYTCYSLNCVSEQWFEFDDQCVTQVSPELVQNCEAYVLFYKKSCDTSIKKRKHVVELIEHSLNESLLQFYLSKQWVNKFNTFAEPGPIDNSDFLCIHGGINPSKMAIMSQLYTVVAQPVWEYLYETFGGGPACNCLCACSICEEELKALQMRISQEFEEFTHLMNEFKLDESRTVIYAISMSWFRQWQSFVRGKELEPPGPIDNTPIIANKNGQPVVKMVSDYAQLSEELWHFFKRIYGGGPEVMLRSPYPRALPSANTIMGTRMHSGDGIVTKLPVSNEKDLSHALKARSTENINSGIYSSGNAPAGGRPARAQSASSDNIALKIAAKNASIHRRQEASRDDTDIESKSGLTKENELTNYMSFQVGNGTKEEITYPLPVSSEEDSGIVVTKDLTDSELGSCTVVESLISVGL